VGGPVEFLPEPESGFEDVEDAPRARRRWPAIAALAAVAVLVAGWATLRPGGHHASERTPTRSTRTAVRTLEAVARPLSGPPGCPPAVFCDVSRDQVPALLGAVQRQFPGARTLTTYTVLRTGEGLEYRQDAFTVRDGLLVITVRARPASAPQPPLRLTAGAHTADLKLSVVDFDLDLQFTGVGTAPPCGRRLLALAEERALTAVA
jgi:hypothetical protein